MRSVRKELLTAHGAFTVAGTLGWSAHGGRLQGGLFLAMAALGVFYLAATEWTVRLGMGHSRPRKWVALALLFGKLGLLVVALRGMIDCFPSQEGPLLSGALLHVLSLFVVAVRRGSQRASQ